MRKVLATGRIAGIVPYAHVVFGSAVVHTSFGFTRSHAWNRASKWLRENG